MACQETPGRNWSRDTRTKCHLNLDKDIKHINSDLCYHVSVTSPFTESFSFFAKEIASAQCWKEKTER